MVEVPNSLHTFYTCEVLESDGRYVVEVPSKELDLGSVERGEMVRVALLESGGSDGSGSGSGSVDGRSNSGPPVEEGEVLDVTIESVGDQGDGIAKVDKGYVLIVPDAGPGEQPTVEVETVRENVGFAAVVD